MKGDERITLLIEPRLRLRLQEAAQKCRCSMSRLVEKALASFLDDQRYEV
jgi:predicted transcriptional regulator